MKIIKPHKLQKGDVIGIISPGSSPDDLTRIDLGVNYLIKLGYRVDIAPNVGKSHGYLAGTDQERAADIHYMFRKKEVRAVFCLRGGYGSGRLLDKIDFELIRHNPKIFVGYSDITALQMAFFTKAGLVTFGGPMVAVDFYNEVSPVTEEFFWKIITSNKKIGKIEVSEDEKFGILVKGKAKGRIVGGNLAVINSFIGTEYFPNFKEKILFLEDTGEAPYRIDRMLNQLRIIKIFHQVNGILLGAFTDCNEHDPEKKTLSLGEVIDDYLGKINKPVIYNFQHGHIKNNLTIPYGINVYLNSAKGIVEYLENAVV